MNTFILHLQHGRKTERIRQTVMFAASSGDESSVSTFTKAQIRFAGLVISTELAVLVRSSVDR